MAASFPHLNELIEDGTRGLKNISKRRMFGCDAYFVGDTIFALIWKTGRIGLKLTDAAAYDELMAIDGAEPWCVGAGKKMSSWVLVPEDFHDDTDALTAWARRSYQQQSGPRPVAAKKTTAKKVAKVAAKKATAKRTAAARA